MRVQVLGSSSSGNCSLLSTPDATILVDVGFSGKKILEKLAAINVSIEDVDAVFITHEHSDHATGIRGLSKFEHLEFFANRETADFLGKNLRKPIQWRLFESGSSFEFKNLNVESFAVPHDAYDPVGFLFECRETQKSAAWATDMGYMPQFIQQTLLRPDFLLLEANYDESLLEADTKRPWSIKQRIRSRHGHLSNEAAIAYLSDFLPKSNWKKIFLGHLSKDCNCANLLEKQAFELAKKVSLDILCPKQELCYEHSLLPAQEKPQILEQPSLLP